MRLATTPDRNKDSCARMLAAVAAASPETTSLPPNIANTPPRKVISQKKPATLALTRGDASAIRPVSMAVLTLVVSLAEAFDSRAHGASVALTDTVIPRLVRFLLAGRR